MKIEVTLVLKNGLCNKYTVYTETGSAQEYLSIVVSASRDGGNGIIIPNEEGAIMLNLDEIALIQASEIKKVTSRTNLDE